MLIQSIIKFKEIFKKENDTLKKNSEENKKKEKDKLKKQQNDERIKKLKEERKKKLEEYKKENNEDEIKKSKREYKEFYMLEDLIEIELDELKEKIEQKKVLYFDLGKTRLF